MEFKWCPVCGWDYAPNDDCGCRPGNCSLRPLPDFFVDPERALAEGYSRDTVEAHRRPPPPPCPSCAALASRVAELEREKAETDKRWRADYDAMCKAKKERDAALSREAEARGLLKDARQAIQEASGLCPVDLWPRYDLLGSRIDTFLEASDVPSVRLGE